MGLREVILLLPILKQAQQHFSFILVGSGGKRIFDWLMPQLSL